MADKDKKFGFLNKWIVLTVSIITILSFMGGIGVTIDSRYAKAKDIIVVTAKTEKNSNKIELNKLNQEYSQVRAEYYDTKKLLKSNPNSDELRDELDELKSDKKTLKDRITKLKIKLGL